MAWNHSSLFKYPAQIVTMNLVNFSRFLLRLNEHNYKRGDGQISQPGFESQPQGATLGPFSVAPLGSLKPLSAQMTLCKVPSVWEAVESP